MPCKPVSSQTDFELQGIFNLRAKEAKDKSKISSERNQAQSKYYLTTF